MNKLTIELETSSKKNLEKMGRGVSLKDEGDIAFVFHIVLRSFEE